jgi:hypothetical protein
MYGMLVSPPSFPFTLNILTKKSDDNLIAKGWIWDKPYCVTIDTRASVTMARHDIIAGWSKRKPSQLYVLQIASGETIPVPKKGTGGDDSWSEHFTNLGVHCHDHGCVCPETLCPAILWHVGGFRAPIPMTGPRRGVIMESRSKTMIILPYSGQWRGDTNSMWEGGDCTTSPLEVVNGLVEPSLKTSRQEGLYIVRTLVQARRKVPVRIINVSNWD